MRAPSTVIWPAVGESSPPIRLSRVVLPEPDGPHERHEIAPGDVEVDAVQHLDALAAPLIVLGDAPDRHQRPGRGRLGSEAPGSLTAGRTA
jgi:hypothetical protein